MWTRSGDASNLAPPALEKPTALETVSSPGANQTFHLLRGGIIFGLFFLLCLAGSWSNEYLQDQYWPTDPETIQMMIVGLILAYAVCMMLPFMPAIEMGLVLLVVLDVQGVLWLYLVTVLALTMSYGIGRLIPLSVLQRLFQFLHLHKASELLCGVGECNEKEQINRFIEHAPKRLIPFLLRHRYLLFAVAINTPGNMIIGGAGGIAMMGGMSRMFGLGTFVLTVMIAVSPLPILTILSKLMIFG